MQKHPSFEQLVEIFYKSDSELVKRFGPHLDQCDACSETLSRMDQLLKQLKAEKAEPSKEDIFTAKAYFLNSTMQDGKEDKSRKKADTANNWIKYLAVAAVLSLLAVSVLMFDKNDTAVEQAKKVPVAKQLEEVEVTDIVEKLPIADSSPAILAKVMAVQGGCYIYEDSQMVPITSSTKLTSGMIVRLHKGASIFTAFGAKNQLMFNEATFKVVSATEKRIEIDLFAGSVASKVAPLQDDQKFIISTSSVTVSVVGTYFAVAIIDDGKTWIAVEEGRVEVRPRNGKGSSMLVDEGETFRIDQYHLGYKKKISEDPKSKDLFTPAKPYSIEKDVVKEDRKIARNFEQPAKQTDTVKVQQTSKEAKHLLEQAVAHQRSKEFEKALDVLSSIIEGFSGSLEADQASYLMGENLLALGKINQAADAFENVEQNIANSNLVENAIYARAHILENRLKKTNDARVLWHKYLVQYPNGMLKEDALYSLCLNVSKSKMAVESFSVCSRFAKEYPSSFRTPTAILKAADSAYELKRFDSAAILYESYTGKGDKKNMPAVLFRLSQSLVHVGKTQTAIQVLRRIRKNYRNSEYAGKASTILKVLDQR